MLNDPNSKYRPVAGRPAQPPLALPHHLIGMWCSDRRRGGNQALIRPMDSARKRPHVPASLVADSARRSGIGFPSAPRRPSTTSAAS